MNKIIFQTVQLPCNANQAFEWFTKNSLLESWLTTVADVDPVVGGKFELFWNPDDRAIDSTLGCIITAIEPGQLLAFEWKGPKQFKDFMNQPNALTHVVVAFIPIKKDADEITTVHLIHTGWQNSPGWDEARQWFENAWSHTFEELKKQVQSAKRSDD